jgi:YfiH family protein
MSSRILTQFGLRDQPAEYWINQNPNLRFIGLKQTHSDRIYEIHDNNIWKWPASNTPSDFILPEGDGLITDQVNLALVVVSADCLPILIHDPEGKQIAACHAGWRGVANRIFPKILARLTEKTGSASAFQISVGPHIQSETFEVGLDVAKTLVESAPLGESARHFHSDPTKSRIDLNQLILLQGREFGIQENQFHFDPRNTFSDSRLASFRRDGARAGRMLSWIALLN